MVTHRVALLGIEPGFEQRVGETEHAVHRRADFVAHHRQEPDLARLLGFRLLGAPALGDVAADAAIAGEVPS